jgi:hypothetical protein
VLLQTGAEYVSTERVSSLYRVILLGVNNVESRARGGKSWRKIPVALCVTEVKCLVNRSLGSSRRPRNQTYVIGYSHVLLRVNAPMALSTDIMSSAVILLIDIDVTTTVSTAI